MKWESAINDFKSFLRLEKSLSPNTIEAYLKDVKKLLNFLELKELNLIPEQIEFRLLKDFITWLNEIGVSAKSQAGINYGL